MLIILPFILYLLCEFKYPRLIVMLRNVSLEFCPVFIDIPMGSPSEVVIELQYRTGAQVVDKLYIHFSLAVYRKQDIRSSKASEDNLVVVKVLS